MGRESALSARRDTNQPERTMNTEQQRIAIAEACGYINVRMWGESCIASMGMNAEGKYWGSLGVPDYLNDLNAMHEVEKTMLNDSLALINYARELRYLVNSEGFAKNERFICGNWHATAAQRAEAFLRTINKWTTNPNEP